MAKRSRLRNSVLALVPNQKSLACRASGQVLELTIASACRYLDEGVTTFINLARAGHSTDRRVAQFLNGWDGLDARARSEPSTADALCDRMGIPVTELLHEIAVTTAELYGDVSAIIAALSLPEIVETGIRSALRRDGTKDRQMLFRHSRFLPVPHGATVGVVNQVAANAIAANRNGEFFVPFEQDILEATEDATEIELTEEAHEDWK